MDNNNNPQPQIVYNFYDQSQNLPAATSVNITHNHFGGSQPSGVDPDEPLSYYITDAELLARIIDLAEHQCTKPQHVKTLIFDELIRAGLRRDMLLSKPFVEALIPHLPQLSCPNVENLQKAFRREV